MRRYKYDMQLATGCVAAGGGIGMLIPPSIVFIVYAILTEQSIGKLFIAGVVPGLMIALMFCAVIFIQCKRNPQLGPPGAQIANRPGHREQGRPHHRELQGAGVRDHPQHRQLRGEPDRLELRAVPGVARGPVR